jgi:hypothetical protein
MNSQYQIVFSVTVSADAAAEAVQKVVQLAREHQRTIGPSATIEAIYDEAGNEIDSDPYEGSFREAADNEGARIAAEGRGED